MKSRGCRFMMDENKNLNVIPVAFICDENFVMPTCVAATSLIKNAGETTFYDIFIIMAECSVESERKILELKSADCEIHIIRRSLEQYSEIKQLAHISKACLLKFEVSNIVDQYDKVIYLDGDIIVRGDLLPLYEIEFKDEYAAGVKDLDSIVEDKGNINAGIMLFNAKKIRDEGILPILIQTRKELGDRASMDQQTYNIVFQNKYIYLPIQFNCIASKLVGTEHKKRYSMLTTEKLNRVYNTDYKSNFEVVNDALIIHFATSYKPWIYTFATGAKEWYAYYLLSPFKDIPFKLISRGEYRFRNVLRCIREDGFKGLLRLLLRKFQSKKTNGKIEWE